MKLLTKALKDKLTTNHNDQDGSKINKAIVKLFNPSGVGTWYLSELDPETNIAFGLCDLGDPEFGYVSIDELSEVRGFMGLGIERDLHFQPTKFDDLMRGKK
jgi:hypothetical protein|tara:strand:+ start:412 stop:717 length:306 start_codon:yes stop_codon:yes gene_type:complete